MERLINRRQQGDLGEVSAIEWLTRKGAVVAVPFGHSPDFDLVADLRGRLLRIQVKTSTQEVRTPSGHLRFSVSLVTCGGNQSWTGVAKVFDPTKVDYLFALTSAGRRWFIPASDLDGNRAIQLGGSKYSEYEIEAAEPIRDLVYGRKPALESSVPGGVSKWLKDGGCKPSGTAFAGSNPASPTDPGPTIEKPTVGRTKMSSHYQVAVPRAVAAAADLEPGDRFRVESNGTGRFVMTRIEEYLELHIAQLSLPDETEDPAGAERRAPD
jgi:bifunctional DNA-binding transcriptional regulator/antitoxin component of YhaV-PrlF toxin-antitoxin module